MQEIDLFSAAAVRVNPVDAGLTLAPEFKFVRVVWRLETLEIWII